MNRENCPKCSFFNSMNRQTRVKINGKVAFLSSTAGYEVNILLSPTLLPPIFCPHFFKLLSPTLPKLVNLILLSPPPLSSYPDTPLPPQKIERSLRATVAGSNQKQNWNFRPNGEGRSGCRPLLPKRNFTFQKI